jgi:two-component system phosphate regulon sensor histidine kinase PhoR
LIGVHKPNGSLAWISINTEPLFHANESQAYAVVVTFSDVSKKRLAERQALELNLEKERIRVLHNFVQGSSHEFRTPLAIIKSSLYLMKRLDDAQKRAEKAHAIDIQIERILNLLTMLNKMSQLDSNISLNLKRLHVLPILEDIPQYYQQRLKEKDLKVVLEGVDALVLGNAEFLWDAFAQIFLNAIQFSNNGGEIRIKTWIVETEIVISIEDDGIGIEPEVLPQIFERFYRLDVAHSTAGFGLGLPLAQSVVEKLGGKITVESQLEQGSRFEIWLPISL